MTQLRRNLPDELRRNSAAPRPAGRKCVGASRRAVRDAVPVAGPPQPVLDAFYRLAVRCHGPRTSPRAHPEAGPSAVFPRHLLALGRIKVNEAELELDLTSAAPGQPGASPPYRAPTG